MKVLVVLACVSLALASPVDYEKPQYKEVEYKEPAAPQEPPQPHQEPGQHEEPVDKSVYPFVVSKGFPYDYRGFPYLNNEFVNGYPVPKQGYYGAQPLYYGYQPVQAYQPAHGYQPAQGYQPAHGYQAPVYQAPATYHAPAKHEVPQHDSMKYYGQFANGCIGDGIYYNDKESFILCSNGNPYVQRCAPGTKNAGAGKFTYGSKYSFADLCGVNLVDTGYGPSNVVY